MNHLQKTKVTVTEQDKTKSYYKYYAADMAAPAPEAYQRAAKPISPAKALPFKDRNQLFDLGYFEAETGYCVMPDGTGYIANLTKMPGVTAEMFDWWFAWHGLDNLRYTIWDPEDHYRAESMQKERAHNPKLSLREKYWDTTHAILEDVGMGPERIYIHFKHPSNIGFEFSKIGTPACSTLVCGIGNGHGHPPFSSAATVMCHFLRDTEDGVELRTRFWVGWNFVDGKDTKSIPDKVRLPEAPLLLLLQHNIKEFTNLAALLPRIYEEEKDHF